MKSEKKEYYLSGDKNPKTLHTYRQTPVPFLIRRRTWIWLRHPRTKQENSYNQTEKTEEYSGKIRKSRKNLPTAWDDLPIRLQRSWKKHRKTQYKFNKKDRRLEIASDFLFYRENPNPTYKITRSR